MSSPPSQGRTPRVFAVACPDESALAWALAVEDLGARWHPIALGKLADAVAACTPVALVVPDSIYQFDPARFEVLANGANTHLVVLDDAASDRDVGRRIGPLIVQWRARRHRARSGVVARTAAGTQEGRRTSSGLRWTDLEDDRRSSG